MNNIFKPKEVFDYLAITGSSPLPLAHSSYRQACQHPQWRNVMQVEFDALQHNQTWSLVPPSPHYNVIV